MQSVHTGVHRMEEDVSKDVEEVIEPTVSLLPSALLERLGWQSETRCLMAGKRQCLFCLQARKTEDLGNYKLLHSRFCHGQK